MPAKLDVNTMQKKPKSDKKKNHLSLLCIRTVHSLYALCKTIQFSEGK